jgi:cell division protein FtsA
MEKSTAAEKSVAALEITSTGIRLAVGYVYEHNVYILHALETTKACLHQGMISDEAEMSNAIRELVNTASKTLNFPITAVVLGLPSIDLVVEQGHSETNTTDPASHVKVFDGSNCLEMIMKQKTDEEGKKVVVDVVPYQYILEKGEIFTEFPKERISRRIGMAADVEIMDGLLVKTFSKVVNDAGLRVEKIINTTNAAIKYISSFQKSNTEYVYIDIGARLTSIGYAYDNRLYKAETVNYGSDMITDELVKRFSLTPDVAKSYKEIYGISNDPPFDFATKEGIKVGAISEVIKKSLSTLTDKISAFNLSIDGTARNLFIVSGGGADLLGLDGFLANQFQNRILLFTPTCFGARNKSYTNCVAMIKYFSEYEIKTSPDRPIDLTLTRINTLVNPAGPAKAANGSSNAADTDEKKPDGQDERL